MVMQVREQDYKQYIDPSPISSTSWPIQQWARMLEEPGIVEFPIITSTGEVYIGVLEREDHPQFLGYYNASVIGFPGCVSYGEDILSAKANLRNALQLYLEELHSQRRLPF